MRPTLRDEVRDPRILRFDPASRAIWSLAVLPGTSSLSAVELTNWTDQVLKKRLQNVSGVGAVNMVGGTLREINIYLNPQAMESLGVSAEQIANAVASEAKDMPVGSLRSLQQDRVIQIEGRMLRPEMFGQIIVARKATTPIRLSQVATVKDGAQEVENLALYNGQRTLLITVQKALDENTIEVVDNLNKAVTAIKAELPKGGCFRGGARRFATDSRGG
jgi:HAE1 family hydrophobic/amphiphilic exporter-1